MKGCELCSYPARMYCESDEASLCWECDEKVHCANFLVAKHSRTLLCQVCQSPTPWQASGPKLGPTVSVCETCVDNCNKKQDIICGGVDQECQGVLNHDRDDDDDDDEDDDDDDDEEEEEDDGDDEYDGDDDEDEDNQVVPWSSTTTPPPPVLTSSSSSEGESWSGFSTLKRRRENADLDSDDDIGCSSSQLNHNDTSRASEDDEATTSFSCFRPMKEPKTTELTRSAKAQDRDESESRSEAIISSLKRFQQNMISGKDATATILGICELSKDAGAVDLVNFHQL